MYETDHEHEAVVVSLVLLPKNPFGDVLGRTSEGFGGSEVGPDAIAGHDEHIPNVDLHDAGIRHRKARSNGASAQQCALPRRSAERVTGPEYHRLDVADAGEHERPGARAVIRKGDHRAPRARQSSVDALEEVRNRVAGPAAQHLDGEPGHAIGLGAMADAVDQREQDSLAVCDGGVEVARNGPAWCGEAGRGPVNVLEGVWVHDV